MHFIHCIGPSFSFDSLSLSVYSKSMSSLEQTHMTVEDDGPYESKDDGRTSIYDVRDVYVHQFNLVKRKRKQWNPAEPEIPCFAAFCKDLQTFSWGRSVPSRCRPSAERRLDLSAFSTARHCTNNSAVTKYTFSLELRHKHLKRKNPPLVGRSSLPAGWGVVSRPAGPRRCRTQMSVNSSVKWQNILPL